METKERKFKHHTPPGRGKGPGRPVEKAKDFKGTVGKLFKYIGKYKVSILIVMICAIGSTIFSIVGPKVLGKATTEIFNGLVGKLSGTGGIDFGRIGKILLILLALYACSTLFGYAQGIIMAGVSQKMSYGLRKELSEKINRMPMNYYDKQTHGEVLSRVTNDVDTLGTGINQTITQLITSVVTIIGILIMMLSISPVMTLIALLILPISGGFVGLIFGKSQGFFVTQQKSLGRVNGHIEEVFGGHNVVKLFNKEKTVVEEFTNINDVLYDSAWKAQFISGMMQPILNFVGNIGYVAVAVLGGYLSIQGTIQVGDIQSFIQYVRQFTNPISHAAHISNMLQSTVAAAERVFEFLEEAEEPRKTSEDAGISPQELEGNVTFKNVHFGYNEDKIIINDFSAEVKNGQKVAIVGPTGAGKTTIVKLLMRFYDISSGKIEIDGHDVSGFDRGELRSVFGMVLQDTWLFKGSIMENIRYGKLDATDEEVINAAKAAHAHHFIQTLPGGYDMELNEDATNVSQGQRQLLTIARAILADSKILILDEATSSVDTRTEVRIQKAMDNLMSGRTSFVIAHRLSTIRDADMILVMRDGDIVEQGNHEELLAKGGFYSELYNSQFEVNLA